MRGHDVGELAVIKISPLAPKTVPDMPALDGVRLATAAAGIRYRDRTDVLLVELAPGTAVAGVFTKSKCASAPVDWCRQNLKSRTARALVVNSGNANAFTGKTGREACQFTACLTAKAIGCRPGDVYLASTGVIGEPLNASAFDGVMEGLVASATGERCISKAGDPRLRDFRRAFTAVLANLAEQIARDGEGARKLVEIEVEGAVSKASARRIAMSIANSPLVKTAIAGEDANWGRVVMAVGKAGEPADRDKLAIWFGGIRVAHKGMRDPDYDETKVSAAMKNAKISLKVSLGLGRGRDRVLTCDLTKEYGAIQG